MAIDFIEILRDIRGKQLTTALAAEDRTCIYGDIKWMYTTLSDASADLQIISDNMTSIVSVGGSIAAVNSLYADKITLDSLYADKATLDSIFADKAKLDSLFADKAKLDSLYADKATLDSLFADKIKLDSLYADKAVLDSLFADKAKLDSIFADKATLDSLFTDKAILDSLYADKAKLDSLYADKVTLDAVFANLTAINAVNNNKANIDIVAANNTNITTVSSNIANVNTTATNISSVNQVAADTLVINDVASNPLRQSILDAEGNATAAIDSANYAELRAWEAEAARRTSDSYATEPTDVFVKIHTSNGNGTFSTVDTTEYSALHYRNKAEAIVGGGLANFSRYGVVSGLEITGLGSTTYDISAGTYYIGDTLYTYAGSTGNVTGLDASQTLLVIGLDATLNIVTKKGTTFTDLELTTIVEIGALATNGGATNIIAINESIFRATSVLSRLNVRTKNYIETIFDSTAGVITESSTPLQIDIAGGFLNDAEMDSKEIVPAVNVGGVLINHNGLGDWQTTAVATHVLTTSTFDNGSGLVAATNGRYLAYDIYRSSRTGTIYVISPQGEHLTFSEALNSDYSDNDILVSKGLDVVPLARAICKAGGTNIRYIKDSRVTISKVTKRDYTTEGTNNLSAFGNGTIVEAISMSVVSDGVNVVYNYSDPYNGHLTCQFDEQNFQLPNGSIALNVGTDTVPVRNYVYVSLVVDTPTVFVSTSGFPTTQHTPLADILLQSAASVQADGALVFHGQINHMQDENGGGHLNDINTRLRKFGATYDTGMDPATVPIVGDPAVVNGAYATITAGSMFQLHRYPTDAVDISVDGAYVLNSPVLGGYAKVFDFDTLFDANGDVLDGRRYNIVLLISGSQDGTKCFINLPNGSYNNDANAIIDINRTAVYTIPASLIGTTVLAARITIKHNTALGGSYEILNIEKITGQSAVSSAGSTIIKNEYSDSEFKLYDDVDITKAAKFELSGVTTGFERLIYIPDESGTMSIGTIADFEAALI